MNDNEDIKAAFAVLILGLIFIAGLYFILKYA